MHRFELWSFRLVALSLFHMKSVLDHFWVRKHTDSWYSIHKIDIHQFWRTSNIVIRITKPRIQFNWVERIQSKLNNRAPLSSFIIGPLFRLNRKCIFGIGCCSPLTFHFWRWIDIGLADARMNSLHCALLSHESLASPSERISCSIRFSKLKLFVIRKSVSCHPSMSSNTVLNWSLFYSQPRRLTHILQSPESKHKLCRFVCTYISILPHQFDMIWIYE